MIISFSREHEHSSLPTGLDEKYRLTAFAVAVC